MSYRQLDANMWILWTLMAFYALKTVDGNASGLEKRFPDNFLLGASTSAYQTEGGWNADGKGVSTWDYYLHNPDIGEDYPNADIAADSYHLYKKDIQILKHLGAKTYRFSLSWTRILPNGTADYINPKGIAHYRRLIDLLLENDILPIVTIYHWDLPIAFGKKRGWLNEAIVDKFEDYARVVFAAFGDKVKHWITINEPYIHCLYGYEIGEHPPLIKSPGKGFYECGRNLLLGHAKVYHMYNEEFREVQGGQVGLAIDAQWPFADSDSEEDGEAVKDYLALYVGQYIDPIFKGDYPQRLKDRVAAQSARQGYPKSRLRPLSKKQKSFIHGTVDFLGVNHYSSLMVYRNESVVGMYDVPSFYDDVGIGTYMNDSWTVSSIDSMRDYAPGFYSLLLYLKDNYNNPVVYITESGFPLSSTVDLDDWKKADYIRNYLSALLEARDAGSNCQGYLLWSLIDTFEWSGYMYKFGLYQVDFEDPGRSRTPRKSALVYKEIIRTGTIDFSYDPDPYEDEIVF